MKRFIFRLETLLRVRKAHEGTLKRDLEHVRQKWQQAQEEEKMLRMQIEALMSEMEQMREAGRFDLQETYSQILDQLHSSLASVEQNLTSHHKLFEEHQERLKMAVTQRKIIEKIKEKHYTGWRLNQAHTEGALLDEITSRHTSSPH